MIRPLLDVALGLDGAALQCVRKDLFSDTRVERSKGEFSPGGATELSPALQRWEKRKERLKSRRDDRVLTNTLQRCNNWLVFHQRR